MIYDYTCPNCSINEEIITSIENRDVQKCKKCGQLLKRKEVNKTTFVLKGTCWEKDNYSKG